MIGSTKMQPWELGELADAPRLTARSWMLLLGPGLVMGGATDPTTFTVSSAMVTGTKTASGTFTKSAPAEAPPMIATPAPEEPQ